MSLIFSDLERDFTALSVFREHERQQTLHEDLSFTGRRAIVYFAARDPELCSFNLLEVSVVMPQYNVPSEHSRR
jgi:hypothetical protein